jgi:hypothetical protein
VLAGAVAVGPAAVAPGGVVVPGVVLAGAVAVTVGTEPVGAVEPGATVPGWAPFAGAGVVAELLEVVPFTRADAGRAIFVPGIAALAATAPEGATSDSATATAASRAPTAAERTHARSRARFRL